MITAVLPMGAAAVLVAVDDPATVAPLAAAARAAGDGLEDVVEGAESVLLVARPGCGAALADVVAALRAAPPRAEVQDAVAHVLDVVYDGEDLRPLAVELGVAADELVRRHTAAPWSVGFTGFAPGFGYLRSPAWPFDVPRLATPRTLVPAGAVGLAGPSSGVYPRPSPGGWRLIGRTDAVLWDLDRERPALLRPGDAVAFRSVPG